MCNLYSNTTARQAMRQLFTVVPERDRLGKSPFWRGSFEDRRRLVPATSIAKAKGRSPATFHWFGLGVDNADERQPFAFARLWRAFTGEYRGEKVEIDTHTVVTTTPSDLVRPIHPDRMPVVLEPGDHETWLVGSPDEAAELLRPIPADGMRIVREGVSVKEDAI